MLCIPTHSFGGMTQPTCDVFPTARDAHARPSFDFRRPSLDFHRPSFEFSRSSLDFDFPRPSAPPLPFFSLPGFHALDTALNSLADSALDFLADFPPPLAHAPHSTHPAEDSTAAGGEGGDGFPTEAEALAKADYGRRLIEYEDLPFDWRNNPFVVSGYRFIPLTHPHWLRLPLSVFTLHNETLNIHTHLLPLLAWGLAFAGFDLGPLPLWLKPLAPWLEWLAYPLGNWARYTPFAVWSASPSSSTPGSTPHTPDPAESLFTLFALLCLLSSALWHTMAGCAHKRAIETCARIDYVGIGWLIAVSVGAVVRWGYGCEAAPLSDVHTTLAVVGGGVGGGQGQGVVKRVLSALGGTLAMQSAFVGPLYLGARLASTVLASAASILAPTAAYVGPACASACDSLVAYLDSLGSLTSFASVFEYAAASLPSVASMHASLSSLLATMPTYHPVYSRLGTGSVGWRTGCVFFLGLAFSVFWLACCVSVAANANFFRRNFALYLPNRRKHANTLAQIWRLLFFVGISFRAVAPMASVAFFRGWAVMWQFIAPIVPSLLYYLVGLVIYAAHVPSGGLSATMDAEAYGGAGVGRVGERYVWGEVSVLRLSTIFMLESHEDSVYLAKLAVEVLSITYKVIEGG
ncbi:IZH family channel protein [Mycena sanguinolenta]|uniref:IZH family channel protein n=1 Tax=Mycena sanguinolenta TaxID=230812 RepID=A0A8H6Y0E9_9AGAR|nr:IZH family channel protein [Mycena sanguinolenta]